jgi:hypothetical protein
VVPSQYGVENRTCTPTSIIVSGKNIYQQGNHRQKLKTNLIFFLKLYLSSLSSHRSLVLALRSGVDQFFISKATTNATNFSKLVVYSCDESVTACGSEPDTSSRITALVLREPFALDKLSQKVNDHRQISIVKTSDRGDFRAYSVEILVFAVQPVTC